MSSQQLTIPESALARLRQAASLEASVVPWRPDDEPTLEGIIAGGRDASNPYGQRQRQMIVQTPDGRTVAVWLSSWLSRELRVRDAQPGDIISLTRLGKAESKRGTSYNRMALTVLKE